jgi:hypothetical protein
VSRAHDGEIAAAAEMLAVLARLPEERRMDVMTIVVAVFAETNAFSDSGRRALRERVRAVTTGGAL